MRTIVVALTSLVVSVSIWAGPGVAGGGHAAAATAKGCNEQPQVYLGTTSITLSLDVSCTQLYEISGSVLLQNFLGTDCGNHFGPAVSTSDHTGCTYSPAPPAYYTATFRLTTTSLDGSTWLGGDGWCTGQGTTSLSCTTTRMFVYAAGQADPPQSIDLSLPAASLRS
jgi:hypothetical protein